jgi:hypothetical protein
MHGTGMRGGTAGRGFLTNRPHPNRRSNSFLLLLFFEYVALVREPTVFPIERSSVILCT